MRHKSLAAILSATTILGTAGPAVPQGNNLVTFGYGGHVEMPSALMQPDGETSFSYGYDEGRSTLAIGFQALPGLELSMAIPTYTVMGAYTDPSLNIKTRLWQSNDTRTTVSLGFDGILANDRNSAEYLVATHTWGDFDLSLGLGWGRLGSGGPIDAPLGPRPPMTPGTMGTVDHLFMGDAALFGGINWRTPIEGLTLSVDYGLDSVDLAADPRDYVANYGLRYSVAKGADVMAYMRGDEAGLLLTFYGNPYRPYVPPNMGTGPQPVSVRAANADYDPHWADDPAMRQNRLQSLRRGLDQEDIRLVEAHLDNTEVTLVVNAPAQANNAQTVGRVARILSRVMPPSVETFRISHISGGFTTSAAVISRTALEQSVDQPGAGEYLWERTRFEGLNSVAEGADFIVQPSSGFSWNIRPDVDVTIDATDGLVPTARATLNGRYTFSPQTWASGTLSYIVYGGATPIPPPPTPKYRSDGGAYDRESIALDSLMMTHLFKLSPDVFGRVSGGLFERQYAGVSGELIWRPANETLAFGLELTHGIKRDYTDPLGFLDLQATTAIGTLYWDTGFHGTNLKLDFGQYLAGDLGAGVTLARHFPNGWDVSLSTTWTEPMGDDELNIAIGVSIPLNWSYPTGNTRTIGTKLGGGGGNYGSRIGGTGNIYGMLRSSNAQSFNDGWGEFWN